MEKEEYTAHLLNGVFRSREVAIRELSTMGENQIENLHLIESWYASIINWIKRNPPNYFVKYLEIQEGALSEIKNISYCYHAKDSVIGETVLRLYCDMSIN